MSFKKKSLEDKFMEEISRIKEAEIFIGIARLLSTQLLEEKDKPKDFTVLFQEVMEKFRQLERKRKKEFIQILKNANKESLKFIKSKAAEGKEKDNGIGTENSQT